MDQSSTTDSRSEAPTVEVAKSDLLAAWSVLENLAVSLDQIGGTFAAPVDGPLDGKKRLALLEALNDYLSADLIDKINKARLELGSYIEDEEAEAISERITYWNYAT